MNNIVDVRLLPLHAWRLIPWYSSGACNAGCCFNRTFTWLFLAVRWVVTKEDV